MDYRVGKIHLAVETSARIGGSQWNFSLTMSATGGPKTGDRYCAAVNPGGTTSQNLYVSSGVSYRLTGYTKTASLTAGTGAGASLYIGTMTSNVVQGTQDWTAVTVDYAPSQSGVVAVGCTNTASSGTVYFDDLSVRCSSDGGQTWSSECLTKGDIDFENYIDLGEAWKADSIFQAAEQYGVYLKTVISEKQDSSLGCINADGSTGTRSDDNFYSSENYPSAGCRKRGGAI